MSLIFRSSVVAASLLSVLSLTVIAHAQISVTLTPDIPTLKRGPNQTAFGSLNAVITVAPDYTFAGYIARVSPSILDGSEILTSAEIDDAPAFSSAIRTAQPGQGYSGPVLNFAVFRRRPDGVYAYDPLSLPQSSTITFAARGVDGDLATTTISYGINLVSAPEPAALPLLVSGMVCAGIVASRRRHHS